MILSNILNNNKKIYIYKLLKTIHVLNNLKISSQTSKNLSNIIRKKFHEFNFNLNSKKIKNQNLISYIINVILSPTNTVVNITDTKGNVIISISAGLAKLTKFQKKSQPTALITIFKLLMLKSKFLENKVVALHFKNVKRFHESLIIKALKNFLLIKSFQSSNLTPHNGCRPKKLKRIKRRTKRLVIK